MACAEQCHVAFPSHEMWHVKILLRLTLCCARRKIGSLAAEVWSNVRKFLWPTMTLLRARRNASTPVIIIHRQVLSWAWRKMQKRRISRSRPRKIFFSFRGQILSLLMIFVKVRRWTLGMKYLDIIMNCGIENVWKCKSICFTKYTIKNQFRIFFTINR